MSLYVPWTFHRDACLFSGHSLMLAGRLRRALAFPYHSAQAAITNHRPGGLNNRGLFSHRSGDGNVRLG